MYLYKHKTHTYIVIALDKSSQGVEIHFIGKVGGGKGKNPKDRIVQEKELIPMTSTKEFHKVMEDFSNALENTN